MQTGLVETKGVALPYRRMRGRGMWLRSKRDGVEGLLCVPISALIDNVYQQRPEYECQAHLALRGMAETVFEDGAQGQEQGSHIFVT